MQAELIDTGSLERAIEAVLFVASESLSIKTLAKLTGASEPDVSVALQTIDADYAARGIVLREVAGGYRFATSPAARTVVEAYLMPPKTNLSPAALETLAIVAYMQPVTKGDIEGIRGVSADSVLSTLVDRRFLVEAGRKDVAGRPILYKTTPEFLEAFGLRSLEELPPIDIDADAPIELAFPISLQALDGAATDEPAGETGPTAGAPGASVSGAAEPSDRATDGRPDRTAHDQEREIGDPQREASQAASAVTTDAEQSDTAGGVESGPAGSTVRADDDAPPTDVDESENVLAP